jgi:hypothetical protein
MSREPIIIVKKYGVFHGILSFQGEYRGTGKDVSSDGGINLLSKKSYNKLNERYNPHQI